MSSVIKRMAHVGLKVPDLDASVAWATTVMGMREVERVDGVSYLTHKDCHHSLEYLESDVAAVDHISMEAHDAEALSTLVGRLREENVTIVAEQPQERGIAEAVRFLGPDGHVFEVFTGMEDAGPIHTGTGVQPRKFGHPTLTAPDIKLTQDFFQEVLEFRLSDEIGPGLLSFLRCNPDHHGIGLQKGEPGINHYAWEVENVAVLTQLGETLAKNGSRFIWGPGRHGAGNNLFTYHYDPAGCIVEYYADIYQVWDEATYEPGRWAKDDPDGQNLWGPGAPLEMLTSFTPLADSAPVA
ncbi:MAG: VOC family protein [Actinobacteria bacterium]|nr:VOC family protein [Actinomycetota bacterium]